MEGVPQPYLADLQSPWLLTAEPSPGMIHQVGESKNLKDSSPPDLVYNLVGAPSPKEGLHLTPEDPFMA